MSQKIYRYILFSVILLSIVTLLFWKQFSESSASKSLKTFPSSKTDLFCQPNPEQSSNLSLRDLADKCGMRIGAAVLIEPLRSDLTYRQILAEEFNSLTPENAMKFGQVQPDRDRYDFTDADFIVDFAQQHQMNIHGHVLVWYRSLPEWLTKVQWSREELLDILHKHISTVVGHFRGRVPAWDVVNEAISPDGRSLRDSIWLKAIGPEYIKLAFRWAHEADPAAQLFYNDYKGEGLGQKSDRIYALLQTLKQDGVPIHGVGLQMHVGIDEPPDPTAVAANMKRIGALGLKVKITEMDVQTLDGIGSDSDKSARQAEVYQSILQTCLHLPNCTGLSTWGVADQFSWIRLALNRPDSTLLFDENYRKKPSYDALRQTLQKGITRAISPAQ